MVINVDGAGRVPEAVSVETGGPAHGLLAALDQAGGPTGPPAVGIGAGMAATTAPPTTTDRTDPATMAAITRLVVATVWFLAASPGKVHR